MNAKVADVIPVSPEGPDVMETEGLVLSTVQVRLVEAELPASSVAVTVIVWLPSVSPE